MINRNKIANHFDTLCDRAKELFFEIMDINICPTYILSNVIKETDFSQCESPIEETFLLAFKIASIVYSRAYDISIQTAIRCNDKDYRADFLFDVSSLNTEFLEYEPYKLVIECDGHDFHEKTKEQVQKNNERDLNLKMCGYDVIHFSGSQIYSNPLMCALNTIKLIEKNTLIFRNDIDGLFAYIESLTREFKESNGK